MDDKTLWGVAFMAYLVPLLAVELYRQVRRGDNYSPNWVTGWGWSGALLLLGLWSIKMPAVVAVALDVIAVLALAVRYGLHLLKRRRAAP